VTVALPTAGARARAADFLDLTKPRLSLLVLATLWVGVMVAPAPLPPPLALVALLLGTAAVIGGANAFNCCLERESDALMRRTRDRPLPAGRLTPLQALGFASALSVAGVTALAAGVSPLCAGLALVALLSYVLVYTPLKRRTSFCTVVGAVPGAIPPMIGWAASTGGLEAGAWVLFACLFLWQPAHFLSLAWVHREDYARAGMPMLPVVHPDGRLVALQMFGWFGALVPVSAMMAPVSRAGGLTLVAGPGLGLLLVLATLPGVFGRPTVEWARRCFLGSIAYLSLWLVLMLVDASGVLPRWV
jgi:protoheme IX farnesyltransferase